MEVTSKPAGDPQLEADLSLGDEPRWQWVGAAAGIAAVVFILASAFVAPQPPKSNASVAKILKYVVDDRRRLLFSAWLGGLGGAFFLWFVGSLRGAMSRAADTASEMSAVVFAGGVATAAIATAASIPQLVLVYRGDQLQGSPDLVRVLYDANTLGFTLVFFTIAVFIAGASLLSLQRRIWAPWLGAVGLIVAIYDLFAAGAISDFTGARSPTGAVPFIAFISFAAFTLAFAIGLLARVGAPPRGGR
jgi:hypothetical protein